MRPCRHPPGAASNPVVSKYSNESQLAENGHLEGRGPKGQGGITNDDGFNSGTLNHSDEPNPNDEARMTKASECGCPSSFVIHSSSLATSAATSGILCAMEPDSLGWLARLAGRFIVFDGPDGCGKTTQARRVADAARAAGLVVCPVRDPGGTTIGEQVRQVLLSTANSEMDVRCELLLYMASRAQLVAEHVAPALKRGELVLADRFISSTLAYQGAAGGVSIDDIIRTGHLAVGECWPDLVVIFDVDESTAAGRLSDQPDRMEQKNAEFHRAVRQGFLDQARADAARHLLIDATDDRDAVYGRLMRGLEQRASLHYKDR